MTSQILIALLIILCHQSDGQPNSNARIFRGSAATKNQFPWYIHITTTFPSIHTRYTAGGVLISMKHVLTVAHLFFGNLSDVSQHLPFQGMAYAGVVDFKIGQYLSTKRNSTMGSQIEGKRFSISDILFYPNNKNPGMYYDIYIFTHYLIQIINTLLPF